MTLMNALIPRVLPLLLVLAAIPALLTAAT